MKRLDQLVSAEVAQQLVTQMRVIIEDTFEPPQRGSSLDDLRDNIWEIYVHGGIEADHPRAVVAAARHAYNEVFEGVAQQHGLGKIGQLRRRCMSQLCHGLKDVAGYKKIEPNEYVPTSEDLAKIKRVTIVPDQAFVDLTNQLTGLEELQFYGSGEREPGLAKALAAALPAPKLRRLTLNGTVSGPLVGAIANPAWVDLDYLALYETNVSKAQLTAALAHWSALATLAIRTEGRLGAAMLAVVATAAPKLTELALVNTQLADAPIQELLLARPWPKLERAYFSGNKCSAAAIKELGKQLPKVKLKFT